jgi:rhodanese-related sulfurtransferase
MSKPLAPLSATELKELLATGSTPRLLDVREPHEFVSELGHVAGSELVPLGTVANNVGRFAGEQRDIVVICRSGMRAGQAADFLAKQGLKTRVLTGGMIAWNEAKLPISRDPQ